MGQRALAVELGETADALHRLTADLVVAPPWKRGTAWYEDRARERQRLLARLVTLH
jgi:hypothetical protein